MSWAPRFYWPFLAGAAEVLLRELLDRAGDAAVGVTLPEHGVHSGAEDAGVAGVDLLLSVGLGVSRVVGEREPSGNPTPL